METCYESFHYNHRFNPVLQQWFTARIKLFGDASKPDESSMIAADGDKKYYQSYGRWTTSSIRVMKGEQLVVSELSKVDN